MSETTNEVRNVTPTRAFTVHGGITIRFDDPAIGDVFIEPAWLDDADAMNRALERFDARINPGPDGSVKALIERLLREDSEIHNPTASRTS